MAMYVVYDADRNQVFEQVFDTIEDAKEEIEAFVDYDQFEDYQIAEINPVAKLTVKVKVKYFE